jgi:hypothetical protein
MRESASTTTPSAANRRTVSVVERSHEVRSAVAMSAALQGRERASRRRAARGDNVVHLAAALARSIREADDVMLTRCQVDLRDRESRRAAWPKAS